MQTRIVKRTALAAAVLVGLGSEPDPPIKPFLLQLGRGNVDHGDCRKRRQQCGGQRDETKGTREWQIRRRECQGDETRRGGEQESARSALVEGAARANDERHDQFGQQRLDEPARPGRPRVAPPAGCHP